MVAFAPLCNPGRPWEGRKDLLQNDVIAEIAKKHDRTPAQVVLQWNIGRQVAVIPKTSNPDRAKQNLGSLDFTLDEEDRKKIAELECGARGFDAEQIAYHLYVPLFV